MNNIIRIQSIILFLHCTLVGNLQLYLIEYNKYLIEMISGTSDAQKLFNIAF